MLSPIMSPIMTPIMTPIMGMGLGDIFGFVYGGEPTIFTSYTRPGNSFSEDANGNIITVPENVPPSETDPFGLKKLRWFNGENLVPFPENPELWDYTGGSSYSPETGLVRIPQGGQVFFVIETTSIYSGMSMASAVTVGIIEGGGILRVFDGTSVTDVALLDSTPTINIKVFDSSSTFNRAYLRNDFPDDLVVMVSRPQQNQGGYLLPYIPVGNTPVQPATLTLRAQDETEQPFTGPADGVELLPSITSDSLDPFRSVLSDGADGSVVATQDGPSTSSIGMVIKPGIFTLTPGTGNYVTFSAKSSANQISGFTSIGDFGDTGFGSINPNLAVEYLQYAFKITPISTAMRFFTDVASLGDSVSIKDFSIQKLLPALSEKPFSDFTEDVPPEPFDFGLDQLLNGRATGVFNVLNLQAQTGAPIITENRIDFIDENSFVRHAGNYWVDGDIYVVDISISNYSGSGGIIPPYDGTNGADIYGGSIIFSSDGDYTYRYSPVGQIMGVFSFPGHSATVVINSIRQASGAVGRIPFDQITFSQVLNPELLTNGTNPTDTGWTKEAGWTISGGAFRYSGTTDSDIFAPIGVSEQFLKFVLIITESTIDGTLMIADGTEAAQTTLPKTVGTHIVRLKNDGATDTNFGLRVEGNTTGTFAASSMSVKEFTSLMQNNDRNTMVWLDPDDGKINVIDTEGNIALSPSAVVADTEFSGHIALNADEFWITKDTVKGVVNSSFSGSLLPTGENIYYDNSGEDSNAQTVGSFYFDDELDFEYVYHEGDQAFYGTEPEIYYT